MVEDTTNATLNQSNSSRIYNSTKVRGTIAEKVVRIESLALLMKEEWPRKECS